MCKVHTFDVRSVVSRKVEKQFLFKKVLKLTWGAQFLFIKMYVFDLSSKWYGSGLLRKFCKNCQL